MTGSGFRKHAQKAVAAVLSGALAFSMCPAAAFAAAGEGATPGSGVEALSSEPTDFYYWDAYCTTQIIDIKDAATYTADKLIEVLNPYLTLDESETVLNSDYYEIIGWEKWDEKAKKRVSLESAPTTEGFYYVVLKGRNGYSGETRATFDINDTHDIGNWGSFCKNRTFYVGKFKSITLDTLDAHIYQYFKTDEETDLSRDYFKIIGWQQYFGPDKGYKAISSAPKTTGFYRAILGGTSPYYGKSWVSFTIDESEDKGYSGYEFTVNKLNYMVASWYTDVTFTGSKAKKVSIPATVKHYGIAHEVTSIAAKALKGSKATKVTVGSNVTTIGASAFANAKKLKTLTIGKSVKEIGKGTLKGCKKLKTITVKSNKLTKSSIKALVKGSKVKTVKLSGKAAKKMKSKYKKWLKGTGVKVK